MMSYKKTVLRSPRHDEFLAAQRRDPITRKLFIVGDTVALCASCLLPFLDESWQAIGGTHCGQSATARLETFETTETPDEDSAHPGTPDPDDESACESVNATPAADLDLRPIPVKLREIPIKLQG